MTGQRVSVSLSSAEVSALRGIRKHGGVQNGFERDLLEQILKKVDRQQDQSWQRFGLTLEDIGIPERGCEPGLPTDAQYVQFPNTDELMDEIDRIIEEAEQGGSEGA